ncbi:MAG TPA: hypothetical protein VIH69_05520, partial [Dehalococcoidia bacterium]
MELTLRGERRRSPIGIPEGFNYLLISCQKSLAIVKIEETAPIAVAFDSVCFLFSSAERWTRFLNCLTECDKRETLSFSSPCC